MEKKYKLILLLITVPMVITFVSLFVRQKTTPEVSGTDETYYYGFPIPYVNKFTDCSNPPCKFDPDDSYLEIKPAYWVIDAAGYFIITTTVICLFYFIFKYKKSHVKLKKIR